MARLADAPLKPANPRANAILAAARLCFGRFGFHAASMARIAAEAGISVGHIYRYFENKEAVVAAIVEEDLLVITEDLETLSGPPDEMAAHILAHFQRTRSRQKAALWLEMLAEGARNPKVAAMIQGSERRLRERLHAALANACSSDCPEGAAEPGEIETRMSLIGLLMDGLQMREFVEGEALPPDLMHHVSVLLAQALSPAPISDRAPLSTVSAPPG